MHALELVLSASVASLGGALLFRQGDQDEVLRFLPSCFLFLFAISASSSVAI